MNSKKIFLSVAGNIGSGKSSLTKILSEKFNWIPYYESVTDNPYLSDFYEDMVRWSFNLQVYFLSHRFKVHKEILEQTSSVIQDRSIYEDVEIFAKNLYELGKMNHRDYENYKSLFSEMTSYLQPPDLLVYLKADEKTLIEQISKRGREFEKNIDPSYLSRLNERYNIWIKEYSHGKSLIIESDNLDFVNNHSDLEFIINKIKSTLDEHL